MSFLREMDQEVNPMLATKDHCKYCFDVLISALNNKDLPPFPSNLPSTKSPLFVTWYKDVGVLRGCIGTF